MLQCDSGQRRMRVVFSNYDDIQNPWYGGGGARAIHEIARRLAARHKVHVVTGRYPGCCDCVVDGVGYSRIGTAIAGPYVAQLSFAFSLPRKVRTLEFDVWVESLTPPFSTACLQKFTNKPVVVLTQVLAGEGMTRKYHLPFASIERRGLRCYRYAIAVSTSIEQRLHAINPQLVTTVIPNGTDRDAIERNVYPSPEHLLFLGRLDVAQKGLDLLLESYAQLTPNVQVPLVIAGGGPKGDTAFVARRVAELGLQNRVRLIGRVGQQEKEDLFRRSVCLLLPSRFEASPLVIVEAFCCRVPVVLFDIPDLSWVPDDCCVRVPAFNTQAFARAVEELINSPERRNAIAQKGKLAAREYDWDKLAARYEEFLQRVIQEH